MSTGGPTVHHKPIYSQQFVVNKLSESYIMSWNKVEHCIWWDPRLRLQKRGLLLNSRTRKVAACNQSKLFAIDGRHDPLYSCWSGVVQYWPIWAQCVAASCPGTTLLAYRYTLAGFLPVSPILSAPIFSPSHVVTGLSFQCHDRQSVKFSECGNKNKSRNERDLSKSLPSNKSKKETFGINTIGSTI